MARILYLWQQDFPWDVRVEKICCALRDAGHDVTIAARWDAHHNRNRPQTEQWNGIRIVRVGWNQHSAAGLPLSGNPVWKRALAELADTFQPHIIMPREIMLAEAAANATKRCGARVIMDMAEHYPAAMRLWKKYSENPLLRLAVHTLRLPDMVERRAVARMDGIITVCDENSERLAAHYGFDLRRTAVVNNTPDGLVAEALNAPPFRQRAPDGRLIRDSGRLIRHFGYHGVLSTGRGLETLVEAFGNVQIAIPDARLTIAGDGETLPDLKRRAASIANIPNTLNIHFTGRYAPSELPRLYGETDVAVIPHSVSDFMNHTLPNKLFDYMAYGIPVVVSDVKPMRRIITETQAGVIADCSNPETLAEALIQLCHLSTNANADDGTTNNTEYRTLSENGIRAAQSRYNWQADKAVLLAFVERFL